MANPLPFKDRVIVVSGASRGSGLATVRYLLIRGAKVSMAATSEANLAKALAGIEQDMPEAKDRVLTMVCDVSKQEQVEAWINATVAKFGLLDGAANVAAKMNDRVFPITQMPLEDLNLLHATNVVGTFNCLKFEMRNIKEGGSIVNCGSIMSKYASPGMSCYCASKHAIIGLTKCAAFEGAARRIRVNALCPGAIDTDMVRQPLHMPNGEIWNVKEDNNTPSLIKRWAKPEEIAAGIAFLLSDESKMVNRQEWYMDGGWCESSYVWS